jgi:hypothetical protein
MPDTKDDDKKRHELLKRMLEIPPDPKKNRPKNETDGNENRSKRD